MDPGEDVVYTIYLTDLEEAAAWKKMAHEADAV